ncbi:hypothetical protein [Nocardia panacis]|uniref:hypothetical protein n=1 Tax=Nocardia panacis TaxID=2340916 RepID=UPI0011C42899|nr:hypothetical protein [Nocardia panacis]
MNASKTVVQAAIAVLGLVAPVLAPANAEAASGDGNAACHITADNPHHSKGSPGWIVGKGRISCTADIDSLEIIVQIERKQGGNWVVVSGPDKTSYASPKANQKYTGQSNFGCGTGEYRTAASGSGVYGGRPSGSMAWQYSGIVTNPCG